MPKSFFYYVSSHVNATLLLSYPQYNAKVNKCKYAYFSVFYHVFMLLQIWKQWEDSTMLLPSNKQQHKKKTHNKNN
jgi:hypothetical protein